ncbi:MAG: aminotransferase class I/II-fold pyridoxal phosphate-dependent enzyme [Planctomycetota bacterium]|nr:aminotransferase class I/II-fold pyridoxal phosphate-dependent enzyme [Planctomycetota bacterium]
MSIIASQRVRSIGGYAFAEVDKKVTELTAQGITPIDLGVGDPRNPTPVIVRKACQEAVDRHAATGYPSYVGSPSFREAVASWTQARHGVTLDPETEICSTIGSKEGIFHFGECFVDPGDLVLVPSPGYPPYQRGTHFAEGSCWMMPLREDAGFLPDLDSIPEEICKRAKILWLNYPNSPSGALAPPEFFEKAIRFAHDNDIVLASDEAYSEIYFTEEKPHSLLEFSREGVIVFQSLSKRSAMTGYRIGWVAGDPAIVDIFKKVKTNVDSGTPNFVQEAGIAALGDEEHVDSMRNEYREKRDLFCGALVEAGLPDCTPDSTIYVWQRVPGGMDAVDFATRLLDPEVAIVCTPGPWISDVVADGSNPGDGYVRFALVLSVEETREAAKRLTSLKL